MNDLVLDYAAWKPDYAALKRAGVTAIVRYLAGGHSWKEVTAQEARAIRAAGINLGLVWETTAVRATQGRQAGVDDARRANAQADGLGYPPSSVIFYACDTDATWAQVAPYYAGVMSVQGRPQGSYGSFVVTEGCAGIGVPYLWQTVAWSRGKRSPRAHMLQLVGHARTQFGPNSAYDENNQARYIPFWGSALAASAPTPTPEEDMPLTDTDVHKVADETVKKITATMWDFIGNQIFPKLDEILKRLGDLEKEKG